MMRVLHVISLTGAIMTLALAAAPLWAQGKKPTVLFAGSDGGACGYEVALKLVDAGFVLDAVPGDLPPLETLKKYNVLVISGLGMANADGSLPDSVKRNIAVLQRYLEAGGGVLVLPYYCQMLGYVPPASSSSNARADAVVR